MIRTEEEEGACSQNVARRAYKEVMHTKLTVLKGC